MRALGPYAPLLVLATCAAAGAAAAAGYALTAPDRYRATAQLIVSPVPAGDSALTGIDVLRDTGGKRTAAASAAALVRGPLVADAVRALLGITRSRDSLLGALDAHQVDASDVVAVTAEDTSANGAAQLANAFVDTLINQRSATFQSEVAAAVRRYEQQLAALPAAERSGPIGTELERRLAELRPLQSRPDPSLAHAGQAAAPAAPSWPDVGELAGVGAGIGAGVGALLAIALLLARRARARPAPQYDRGVSDPRASDPVVRDGVPDGRELEQLVDRLESRLLARESALAARERDLRGALEALRAEQAAPARAQRARAEEDERRGRELAELERRERELAERVASVTRREVELAKRAAALAVRERELDAAAAAREAQPQPQPQPEPVRPPAPDVPPDEAGAYNLLALERLVEQRAGDYPERTEEWASYLFFLRDYAAADGTVPAGFDWLIQDTFAELVSPDQRAP
jgi:hypothetical protein